MLVGLHVREAGRFFPSFLSKMHEKRGNFCIFLLKIAGKEGKTDQEFNLQILVGETFGGTAIERPGEDLSFSSIM